MVKIIAFAGKMGSGKSAAVECLKDLGYTPHLLKLAAPLYDIQEIIYNRISTIYTRPADFKKDRKLLQYIGGEWGRSLSPTLWLDLWRKEAEKMLPFLGDHDIIVCDDCRYDNEAETFNYMGGIVIKITRKERSADGGEGFSGHPSEAGISDEYVASTIHNNGTKEELKKQLETVLTLVKDHV